MKTLNEAILEKVTQEEIGRRWGMAKSTVSNSLRLLKLPTEAQQAIRDGQLTERHGKALLMAQAKSPAIFKKSLEAILPPPSIPEETLEKARELVSRKHFWQITDPKLVASCAARSVNILGMGYDSHGEHYLCASCYRAGKYTKPSVDEAEQIVKRTINYFSVSLERAGFPLDAKFTPIPDPELTWLRSATCAGCAYREGDVCLDQGCYELKGKSWQEVQATQLKERLARDYGIDP